MAFNVNFIMQTLGAIVQTYASILAIGGVFYIFGIERMRHEFREAEKNILDAVLELEATGITNFIPNFRFNAFNEGGTWLEKTLNELQSQNSIASNITIQNIPGVKTYVTDFPEYNRLKKMQGSWAYRKFRDLLLSCMMILTMAILFMATLSTNEYNQVYDYAFGGVVLATFAGFMVLFYSFRDIARLDRIDYLWEVGDETREKSG